MASVYLSPSTQEANRFAVGGITEEQNSNAVTDILEKALREKYGITVYRNRPDMNLSQMIADSNAKKPDIHVAIHTNAGGGRGTEVYAYIIEGKVSNSQKLAQYIYDVFSVITPSADRGVKNGRTAKLGEVVNTTATAVLVEMAFHDNPDDAAWLIANRQACSTAYEKGICRYFGIQYKPDVVPAPEPVPAPTGSIGVSSAVKIKAGAVYGGLASARGKAVPGSCIDKPYTVAKIQTNRGTVEALLQGINSWVAVSSLELVSGGTPAPAPTPQVPYKGQKVELNDVPLYNTASTAVAVGRRTGTYYLWDGICINGRYRITNRADRVGVQGQVTGFVSKEYIK